LRCVEAVGDVICQNEAIRRAELQAPVVRIVRGMTGLLVRLPSPEHLAIVSAASQLVFDEVIQAMLLDDGPWSVGAAGFRGLLVGPRDAITKGQHPRIGIGLSAAPAQSAGRPIILFIFFPVMSTE